MARFAPVWIVSLVLAPWTLAAAAEGVGPDATKLAAARERAVAFLKTSQRNDGTWTSSDATGITGLVAYGLLKSGVAPEDPVLKKSLDHLAGLVQPNGSVCLPKSRIPAYETAIAIMTLQAANRTKEFSPVIVQAEKFVRSVQFEESTDTDKSDLKYGGAGYAPGSGRPDLSNTTFFLEALQATGAKSDDPAVQKALVFLSRCQNLETEFNPGPNAVNDGGFFYSPSAGGNSPAGRDAEGGLRSYGSMTYAGMKSMLYAGLKPDDVRVKAAIGWIKQHYTITENPGMGNNGLFYYYYLFAKSLDVLQQDLLEDAAGAQHDWRKELADHLLGLQQPNGSWVNSQATRWFEGDPNLVTAYVLVALQYCEPPKSTAAKP